MLKDRTKFAGAIGLIRTLENKLISKEKIIRMIDAASFEDAYNVLNETCYVECFNKAGSAFDFEFISQVELASLLKLILKLSMSNGFSRNYLLKYDLENTKILLKNNLNKSNDPLFAFYQIKPNDIKKFIEEGKPSIPIFLRDLIRGASASWNGKRTLKSLEIVFDRFYYANLLKFTDSILLSKFVKISIDKFNLINLIRAKLLGSSWDELMFLFINGGSLSSKHLNAAFKGSISQIPAVLKFSNYYYILDLGIRFYLQKGSLSLFENLFENKWLRSLGKAKYSAFGVEPLILFLIVKEIEIKTLRTILICKQNKIHPNKIKESLNIYG